MNSCASPRPRRALAVVAALILAGGLVSPSAVLAQTAPTHFIGTGENGIRLDFRVSDDQREIELLTVVHVRPPEEETVTIDAVDSPLWQVILRAPIHPPPYAGCVDPVEACDNYDPRECGAPRWCADTCAAPPCPIEEIRVPLPFFRMDGDRRAADPGGYPESRPRAELATIECDGDCADADRLTLTWRRVAIPGETEKSFDVVVEIAKSTVWPARERDFLTWTIRVENLDPAWSVHTVKSPVLYLGHLGTAGSDDAVLLPFTHGIVMQNPIEDRNPSPEEAFVRDPDAPPFVHGSIYSKFNYPGKVESQFLAYYDSKDAGADATRAGLYLAADDPQGNLKRLYCCTTDSTGTEKLCLLITHFGAGSTPDDFRSFDLARYPYTVLLDSFDGGWYGAAQIYRSWLLERRPWFFPDRDLAQQAASGSDSLVRRIEISHAVAFKAIQGVGGEPPLDPDPSAPDSDFSKIRSWSEFFHDDCVQNSWIDFTRLNPEGRQGVCGDLLLVDTLRGGGREIVRGLRQATTVDCGGGPIPVPPLFRWVSVHSDAGNFDDASVECVCPETDLPLYRTGGFIHDWNNVILRNQPGDCSHIKTSTCSGSDWMRSLRLARWTQFFGLTNCPDACRTIEPCADATVPDAAPGWDWMGANAVPVTGDGPTVLPCYGPLYGAHAHGVPADSRSGGGTYWMESYLRFIDDLRTELSRLSGGHPDFEALPVGTERANEQILPLGIFGGKYRSAPYDVSFRDAKQGWIASVGAESVPLTSVLVHDFTAIQGEVTPRLKMLRQYGAINLLTLERLPQSPETAGSYRYRMRCATAVLNGAFPNLSLEVSPFRILFDGPPNPGFTCPPSPDWVHATIQNDYEYLRTLIRARMTFKEFLVYGRMLRLPKVLRRDPGASQESIPIARWERSAATGVVERVSRDRSVAELYATAWEGKLPTGPSRIGFVVTDFHWKPDPSDTSEIAFQLQFRPNDLPLPDGTYELIEYAVQDPGSCEPEPVAGPTYGSFNIPSDLAQTTEIVVSRGTVRVFIVQPTGS